MNEALILVPEVQARQALRAERLSLHVLAPPGAWIGCGALRVLRVRRDDEGSTEITAGYDSYAPA